MVLALGLPVLPTYGRLRKAHTTFDTKYWPLSENTFPSSIIILAYRPAGRPGVKNGNPEKGIDLEIRKVSTENGHYLGTQHPVVFVFSAVNFRVIRSGR